MRRLEWVVFAVAFGVLVLGASGGPGWAATSTRAVLAVRLDHTASAPLHDVIASAVALIPVGEPAFRLQLLGAVLAAGTLAGVIAIARVVLPKQVVAGVIGALVLLLAPGFRDALATPQMLAACGLVWMAAYALEQKPAAAFACCALVVGSAPWLGLAFAIGLALWFGPKQIVAICIGAIGLVVVVLWFDAIGSWPGLHGSLAEMIAATSHGAGAVAIGVGLIGLGLGAATGLRHARVLGGVALVTAGHAILIGTSAAVLLASLAIGAAIVAAAIARMIGIAVDGWKRDAVLVGCGAPILIASFAMGIAGDDPGTTPRVLVHDLVDDVPTGPGTFFATRAPAWFAISYERTIAGLRPDLQYAASASDIVAVAGLRSHQIVAADTAGFGRLDLFRARPRGRGFQLLGERPSDATLPPPPAQYESELGRDEALALALERAEYEAASTRLGLAARALDLQKHRFGAADLALLSATTPASDRPPLFGYLPTLPRGPWVFDAFGDDLAWMANIPLAEPPIDAPMPRRLLALWRKILLGTAKADDAVSFGPAAVDATRVLLADRAEKNTAR